MPPNQCLADILVMNSKVHFNHSSALNSGLKQCFLINGFNQNVKALSFIILEYVRTRLKSFGALQNPGSILEFISVLNLAHKFDRK